MAKLLLSDFLQVVPTSGFGRSYITLADSTPGFESKFGVRIVRIITGKKSPPSSGRRAHQSALQSVRLPTNALIREKKRPGRVLNC
ncbi:hypothetical protein LINPERHAP2_LOCUS7919 [Linum perenne]